MLTTQQRNNLLDATDSLRNSVGYLEHFANDTADYELVTQQINEARNHLTETLDQLVESGDLDENDKEEILNRSNEANEVYAVAIRKGIEISQATFMPLEALVTEYKNGNPPQDPALSLLVMEYVALGTEVFTKINSVTEYVNQYWQNDAELPDQVEEEQDPQMIAPHHTESSSSNED